MASHPTEEQPDDQLASYDPKDVIANTPFQE